MITLADAMPNANQFLLVVAFLISCCAGLATIGLWWQGRKEKNERQSKGGASQPAKRFNYDLAEERHDSLKERLDKHDRELETIQSDRARTLKHINRRFERVLLGLTVIATKLKVQIPDEEEEEE